MPPAPLDGLRPLRSLCQKSVAPPLTSIYGGLVVAPFVCLSHRVRVFDLEDCHCLCLYADMSRSEFEFCWVVGHLYSSLRELCRDK